MKTPNPLVPECGIDFNRGGSKIRDAESCWQFSSLIMEYFPTQVDQEMILVVRYA